MKSFKLIIFILFLSHSFSANADQDSTAFSHELFQLVLSQHVSAGFVNYPAINKSADYHAYLSKLEAPVKHHNSIEELSYLINAYNALAIKGILDGRSPETFFGKVGYFYNAEYLLNGKTTNLYDLEHDIIIPLGEPRIHFALNCASASCPKLSNTVYHPDRLEQQLEHAATVFINDETRNYFDLETKTAHLSKIFDWFEDDFIKHSGSVQSYLALYIADNQVSAALANNEFTVEYLEYDWSLNGAPPIPVTVD